VEDHRRRWRIIGFCARGDLLTYYYHELASSAGIRVSDSGIGREDFQIEGFRRTLRAPNAMLREALVGFARRPGWRAAIFRIYANNWP